VASGEPGTWPSSSQEDSSLLKIVVLGDSSQGGAYVLRLGAQSTVTMPFGRFRKGKLITIPRGELLYVGSALKGLSRRLIRHASRSGERSPHPIRAHMLELFPQIGLTKDGRTSLGEKRLRWHVDHLLDHEKVQLIQVFVLRSVTPLEKSMGQMLEREPATFVIERGLGANDFPGNTHLLGVHAPEGWWRSLPAKMEALMIKTAPLL